MNRNIKNINKFMFNKIFFLLMVSIITPEQSPQISPKNVIIDNPKLNFELMLIESVKNHGIKIIVMPDAIPDGTIEISRLKICLFILKIS